MLVSSKTWEIKVRFASRFLLKHVLLWIEVSTVCPLSSRSQICASPLSSYCITLSSVLQANGTSFKSHKGSPSYGRRAIPAFDSQPNETYPLFDKIQRKLSTFPMALPGGYGSGNAVSLDAEDRENDNLIQEVLERLVAQQDEHSELFNHIQGFQTYWDLQQQWNQCAHQNKIFRDKNDVIEMRHRKEDEDERVQKLFDMHHQRILEEQAEQEKKKRHAKELEAVQKEWNEHRQKWKGVIESLDTCQEQLYNKVAGRFVKRPNVQNKEILQKVLQRLHQRMAEKQEEKVCNG